MASGASTVLLSLNWSHAMDLLIAILLTSVYFAPSIADQFVNGNLRFHVLLVNVFLGWTIIAWIYSFIWVFQERKRKRYHGYSI